MGMNQTPASERVHISFFGKRNAGKSSVINAVTGQDLAIVSSVMGTTTDPVYKSMELLPLGPVVVIDTPGIDDEGELGHFSISLKCTHKVMTKREIRAESICFDNVHLRTSKEFKRKIKREIELERVDKSKHSSQKVEFSMEQRQQLLQEFLRKNGGITRLEYSSLTGLSRLKAIDDLNTFIEKGILRKRGAGRTVFYVWQQE